MLLEYNLKSAEIFVITHKPCKLIPKDNIYKMIQAGAAGKDHFLPLTDDIFKDNISNKNASFCELTAMYHIWKYSNADIKGLCHYRRYFTNHRYLSEALSYTVKKYPFILKKEQIERILDNYDLIVGEHIHKGCSGYDYYASQHILSDLMCARDIIAEMYPDYLASFDKCLNSDSFYLANMIYTSKDIFDSYSKWLFDILFEVEKRVDITNRDNYQKRVFGFLSERLLKVWVDKNNLKPYIGYIIKIL